MILIFDFEFNYRKYMIFSSRQTAATEEKTILEDAQRAEAKKRKETNTDWIPRHFEQVNISRVVTVVGVACNKAKTYYVLELDKWRLGI